MKQSHYKKSVIKLAIGGLLFSSGAILVAITNMGAGGASFYRMLVALVVFAGIMLIKNISFYEDKKAIYLSLLAGSLLALDLILWHQSIYIVGPGIASILNNTQIFFMAILGFIIFKEASSFPVKLSILLAAFGLSLLTYREIQLSSVNAFGVLVGVASGLAYALCVATLKLNTYSTNLYRDMFYMSLAAAAVSLIYVMIVDESLVIDNTKTLLYLLGYGVFVQVFAWALISSSVGHVPLAITGLVFLVEPVLILIVDVMFFDKTIVMVQYIGAVILFVAMYVGTANKKKQE